MKTRESSAPYTEDVVLKKNHQTEQQKHYNSSAACANGIVSALQADHGVTELGFGQLNPPGIPGVWTPGVITRHNGFGCFTPLYYGIANPPHSTATPPRGTKIHPIALQTHPIMTLQTHPIIALQTHPIALQTHPITLPSPCWQQLRGLQILRAPRALSQIPPHTRPQESRRKPFWDHCPQQTPRHRQQGGMTRYGKIQLGTKGRIWSKWKEELDKRKRHGGRKKCSGATPQAVAFPFRGCSGEAEREAGTCVRAAPAVPWPRVLFRASGAESRLCTAEAEELLQAGQRHRQLPAAPAQGSSVVWWPQSQKGGERREAAPGRRLGTGWRSPAEDTPGDEEHGWV